MQGVYTCCYLCMLRVVFVWYVGYVILTKPSVAAQSTYEVLLNCSQNILVATHLLLILMNRSLCEIHNTTHFVIICENLSQKLSTSINTVLESKSLKLISELIPFDTEVISYH